MNHLSHNEGVTGGGVPLPDELLAFERQHIPAQADGSHESLGALGAQRMVELSQLGQDVADHVLDGNAITVLGSHMVTVAETKAGTLLTEAEQKYLLDNIGRLKDRDGDSQVFIPLRQRSPVNTAPTAKNIKSLKGNKFALYRRIDALLAKDTRRAS